MTPIRRSALERSSHRLVAENRRPRRKDFATLSPDLLDIFHRFSETGGPIEFVLSRKAANALKTQLYQARLRMQEQLADDPLAQELYPAAQCLYIETEPIDRQKRGPEDAFRIRIILNPLTRAVHGGKLPWKE